MADRGGSQQMNLTAVRRHDPYAAELMDSATQVAVYEYGADAGEWKKTDMQGAFFVYKRSGPPYHSFMVLNRLNTNNLIQPLTREMDWQLQAPFLLYRTAAGSIFGLWFFYETECSRLASRLQTLCQPVGGEAASAAKTASIDLMSLFKKASAQHGPQPVAPPATRPAAGSGGGSGSRPTTPRAADDQKPSGITVADLFAKASKTGQVSIGKQTVRSISVSEVEDAMPDLGGRPRASAQPQLKQQPPQQPPQLKQQLSQQPQQLKHQPQLSKQLSQPARTQAAPPSFTASKASLEPGLNHLLLPVQEEPLPPSLPSGVRLVRTCCPQRDGSAEAVSRQAGDVDRIHQLFKSDLKLVSSEPVPVPKPAASARAPAASAQALAASDSSPAVLMSPMMFSALGPPSTGEAGSSGATGDHASAEGSSVAWSAAGDADLPGVTALTRRQLQQALQYLLRNDETFIDRLHEAYVKSLQEGFRRT